MSWDKVWEEVFKEYEWGKYPAEGLIRFIARNFYSKIRGSVKILEVGCGPGANIWYIAREGFKVYGIDGSKTAIDRAKRRLASEGLKANLRVADAEALPYPEGQFDAVIDNECLAHNSLENTRAILQEARRVLKKRGLFYSRTFTDKTYIGRSQKKLGRFEFNGLSDGPFAGRGFFRLTDRKTIKDLYGKYFRILSIDKLEYTNDNGKWKTSEWIIICQKT